MGHTVYLIFLLSFANFVLIFYRLLIERVDFLNEVVRDLWIFAVLFISIYIPVAVLVGAWHRKTQIKVDADVGLLQSPLNAKIFRVMIDIQTGEISKEDLKAMRKMLKKIEEGRGQE